MMARRAKNAGVIACAKHCRMHSMMMDSCTCSFGAVTADGCHAGSCYRTEAMRFNHYLNAHFQQGECRLIAHARDECRQRDVRLYAIPGFWDVVGVTDGTDAWIAPAAAAPFFKTATGDVADIMRKLRNGDSLPPVP